MSEYGCWLIYYTICGCKSVGVWSRLINRARSVTKVYSHDSSFKILIKSIIEPQSKWLHCTWCDCPDDRGGALFAPVRAETVGATGRSRDRHEPSVCYPSAMWQYTATPSCECVLPPRIQRRVSESIYHVSTMYIKRVSYTGLGICGGRSFFLTHRNICCAKLE
jgi:hypothetical protein